MSQYEVTQAEFVQLMNTNPSSFRSSSNLPVDSVTWYEATNYCRLLTAREIAAGHIASNMICRLPTEAEWEYACRARTTTQFYFGDDPGYATLGNFAWYSANSFNSTQLGGQKAPNRWGLYDMAGNVREWCSDWYDALVGGSVTDPNGPVNGTTRVVRGGYFGVSGGSCASGSRSGGGPSSRDSSYGFRVVIDSGR